MKMLNRLLFAFTFVILLAIDCCGQQQPIFTQIDNAINLYNPASSGSNYSIKAVGLIRFQQNGFKDNQHSELIHYSMKLKPLHGGIGVNYLHNQDGSKEFNCYKLNYSLHLAKLKLGYLSMGFSAGLNQLTTFSNYDFPKYNSYTRFTGDFGLLYTSEKFVTGISISQFNRAYYTKSYQDQMHLHLFLDYRIKMSSGITIEPQALIVSKLNGAGELKGFAGLFNLISKVRNIRFGFGIRPTDSANAMVGWDIKEKYRLGYSLDLGINSINSGVGIHEFCLAFLLK